MAPREAVARLIIPRLRDRRLSRFAGLPALPNACQTAPERLVGPFARFRPFSDSAEKGLDTSLASQGSAVLVPPRRPTSLMSGWRDADAD